MARPRVQSTNRYLVLLILMCAVVFALLRTPFAPLAVIICVALPWLPRFRLKVVELVGLVAVGAISSARIDSPAMALFMTFCGVLFGFVVHRSRGGNGIAGGTIAGCLALGGLGVAVGIRSYLDADPNEDGAYMGALIGPPMFLWIGSNAGFFFSVVLYLVARVAQRDH
jgi:hypothetical protein